MTASVFQKQVNINKLSKQTRKKTFIKNAIDSRSEVFRKIGVLKDFVKKNTRKHLCQSFCDFYEIFKNTFLYITRPVRTSKHQNIRFTKNEVFH